MAKSVRRSIEHSHERWKAANSLMSLAATRCHFRSSTAPVQPFPSHYRCLSCTPPNCSLPIHNNYLLAIQVHHLGFSCRISFISDVIQISLKMVFWRTAKAGFTNQMNWNLVDEFLSRMVFRRIAKACFSNKMKWNLVWQWYMHFAYFYREWIKCLQGKRVGWREITS